MKEKYKYIIISSCLSFVQSLLVIYTIKIYSGTWILEILFTLIFYFLFFKIKLYKHHYLSIILIILTEIILYIALENLPKDISENLLSFLLRLTKEIIMSLTQVLNKYLMEKKSCSVYEIIFFRGLVESFFLGIFSILNYFYFNLDNFEEYFDNFNYIELLVIFGFITTQLILINSILFTNKNYTPCHIFIIYVFGQFANYRDLSFDSIVKIISILFILFMSLVFCEIIEFNCFGLSKNTKNKIIERSKNEERFYDSDAFSTANEIQIEKYEIFHFKK